MVKKLNVIIISATNPFLVSGTVAYDIHKALKMQGINSSIVTNTYAEYSDKSIICLISKISYKFNNYKNRIIWHLCKWHLFPQKKSIRTNPEYYMFGLDQMNWKPKAKKILHKLPFKPDAFIYIFDHWFLNAKDLYNLNKKTNAPILWYMADMAPMTGGCHYSRNCSNYKSMCGNCPGLYSTKKRDQAYLNWKFKDKYIAKTDVRMVAASEWQYQQLMESSLYKTKQKHKILLPIDDSLFKPGDKLKSKEFFNLPVDKKIIFFGAFSVNETRKGFTFLVEALKILKSTMDSAVSENIFLIIAGKLQSDLEKSFQFPSKFLGFLSYSELAVAFQAADVFVCPSIEDSGPMMINQSIMCGTPVVSFEMGIAPDLVHTGETGYRAKLGEISDLSIGINYVLTLGEGKYLKMRENCRALALQLCQPQKQIKKFIEILYST